MNPNADHNTLDTSPGIVSDDSSPAVAEPTAPESELLEDLLVEEISIDGMCGVY